mgnify:CR=1 FL=1
MIVKNTIRANKIIKKRVKNGFLTLLKKKKMINIKNIYLFFLILFVVFACKNKEKEIRDYQRSKFGVNGEAVVDTHNLL